MDPLPPPPHPPPHPKSTTGWLVCYDSYVMAATVNGYAVGGFLNGLACTVPSTGNLTDSHAYECDSDCDIPG